MFPHLILTIRFNAAPQSLETRLKTATPHTDRASSSVNRSRMEGRVGME